MNRKILYSILILLSFCFADNVNAQVIHYDFENTLCDENGENCLTAQNSISYNENYMSNGSYSIFLNNPTNSSTQNGLLMPFGLSYMQADYFHINFDFYALDDMVSYAKLFSMQRQGNGYRYSNFELKNDNVCYFFSDKTSCYSRGEWNNADIVLKDSTIYVTITSPLFGEKYYTYTFSDSFTNMAQFYIGYANGDNSSFYGYIDNLYVLTTETDEIPSNEVPTISIIEKNVSSVIVGEQEYITDVTLDVEFSLIDNDNYLYMYRYGSNSDWSTVTLTESNSFSKTYNENNTFYVRVVDRNTYDVVTSSTYTISKIEDLPDDYVDEDSINTSVGSNDIIFHKCDLSLQTGVALCEITLNGYDTSLYNYYYKIGDDAYTYFVPDEKTQVLPEVYDTSLLFKTIDDISLYKKWQNATDDIVSYDLVLKIYQNTTITILKEVKETGKKQYYTFTITSLTENSDMNQIEEFIYNHLLSKFYFVYQFKQIIEYVSAYDFEENAKAPQFTFDLGFIGIEPVTVDMEVNEHTRLLIHGYIKLFASVMVVYTFIKGTTKLFKR